MIDVRNWGVDKIMQLPDHAFGRRYLILTRQFVAAASTVRWMVRNPLPERFVLWSIRMGAFVDASAKSSMRYALGSQDPADAAAFNAMEPLFRGDFDATATTTEITLPSLEVRVMDMRMPVESKAQQFVVEMKNIGSTSSATPTIEFLISSFPRTVPKWLLYQRDESLES